MHNKSFLCKNLLNISLLLFASFFSIIFGAKYSDQVKFLISKSNLIRTYPENTNINTNLEDVVDCPKDSLTIAFAGQSNNSNRILRDEMITIQGKNTFMYDWFNGVCLRYKEPVIGTEGINYGHVATDVIKNLRLTYNLNKEILIVALAKGGSTVNDWAEGDLKRRTDLVLSSLSKREIEIDYLLWHQGESRGDEDDKTTTKNYISSLQKILDKIKLFNPKIKFGIAIASRCHDDESSAIREAQSTVAEKNKEAYITINTDLLDDSYRYDRCHFNSKGANIIGAKYADWIAEMQSSFY